MCATAFASAAATPQESFQKVSDEYFDQVYFPYSPTGGTLTGYHQYDTQLEDFSRKTLDAQVMALKAFETRVAAIPASGLDEMTRGDREMVLSNIRSTLLSLETIRMWEKNPDIYSGSMSNAAFSLMERKFASPDDRLRSLIAREKLMPSRLDEARANLKNPPRIYTEIAIEQLPGIVSFFEHDVQLAFAEAKDQALKAEFAQTNAAVIAALNSYQAWLKSDLLPKSNGDFRIGAETFSKKLAYDEMVDLPLDKLLEIGRADLRKNQQHFNELAKELEPGKEPQQVLEELGSHHPAPDQLLASFRATFDSLIGFIRDHHIVTIPSDVRPILEETPPFMRATTFASMDTPGPHEKHATEAYFNVTLPDKKLTPAEVEGYMHSFNVGTIISTAVHEAYPGHYVQFLWVPQAPSRVRKLLGASTNVEGWAHYCEQMMLDAGYGQPGIGAKDEHEAKLLRLGQLQDALLRNARFIVGIEMHTGKMSFDQAVEFFQKEGYQSKETAMVETKRGTADPTYLYYTLGKLEIMKLREDLKKKQGAAFSLQSFHDEFLKQGFPPIKIVREAMLGDTSPTL
ncbi:DUF885 domain-containing protein [Occallatibacter riparius]|uniref:DUF885 domain-containing protein n=1 Tax=Occallatibacter riparius TaxID=1002689 RepID=A0A9J7BUU2_9BACT|nr:DUF885 domain-containing protein [Occallatibacter riparius]UWZ86392.1 DUF885 domain-containing protein [Occallatibacter riparius]